MVCNHCEGLGFLNVDQLPKGIDYGAILSYLQQHTDNDIAICDCCGDGQNSWHGDLGQHNESDFGNGGPYEYNGGLPECY